MWFDQWSPFFDMEKTLAEMDRILGGVTRPLELRSVPRGAFPAINIYDQGDAVVLYTEMPGVRPQDIDLSVLNETVTLKAQYANGVLTVRMEKAAQAKAKRIQISV